MHIPKIHSIPYLKNDMNRVFIHLLASKAIAKQENYQSPWKFIYEAAVIPEVVILSQDWR